MVTVIPNRLGSFGQVKAKATYYPGFIRVWIPNPPMPIGLKDSREHHLFINHDKTIEESEFRKKLVETNTERSLRRTRKSIKDYVFTNKFDLFVTFTFKDNRQDIDSCKLRMSDWLKNQQKRKGKFEYLIVPELHKDGVSLHFHALIKGYKGTVAESIDKETGKQKKKYGRQLYRLPGYRLGFSDVRIIDDRKDSQTKVGFYIQKYITKDMPRFKNKNRYWASRSLLKPLLEDDPEEWYQYIKEDRLYEGKFGYILEFEARDNPSIEKLLEGKF